jgi:signal transduction histidine kinase
MFYRATTDSKGSGLGLYIVKSAVEKLRDTIQVQSEFGKGTSFIIEIPNLQSDKAN